MILFTGPTGSGPAAAVCSISDIVTLANPADPASIDDPFAMGLDYGEILIGLDDTLRLYPVEGDDATSAQPLMKQHATGVVCFVPLDADDPIDVALAQLDGHGGLVRRRGAVVALTRHLDADPMIVNRLIDALIERYPAADIPVFTVDPWRRDQLGTALLALIAGVESHALLTSDIIG